MNNRRHIWRGDVGLVAFWSYAPIVSKLMTLMMPLPQEKPWQNSEFIKILCCMLQAWICRISCAWRYNALDWKPIIGFSPQKNNRPLGLRAGCGFVTSPDCELRPTISKRNLWKLAQKSQKKTSIKWVNVGNSWKHFLLAFCSVGFFHFGCFKHWRVRDFYSPRSAGMEKWLTSTTSVSAQSKTWNPEALSFFWIIQKDVSKWLVVTPIYKLFRWKGSHNPILRGLRFTMAINLSVAGMIPQVVSPSRLTNVVKLLDDDLAVGLAFVLRWPADWPADVSVDRYGKIGKVIQLDWYDWNNANYWQ